MTSNLLRHSTFKVILRYGHSTELSFALKATVQILADSVPSYGPQRGTSFELDNCWIPYVSIGSLSTCSGRVFMCMWPYIHVHVAMYPQTSDHVSTLKNFVTYVTCERGHLSTCTWLCVHVHMAVYPYVCGHVSTCTWPFIHVVMNQGEHGHVFTCRI
jgi:hypothetical protein